MGSSSRWALASVVTGRCGGDEGWPSTRRSLGGGSVSALLLLLLAWGLPAWAQTGPAVAPAAATPEAAAAAATPATAEATPVAAATPAVAAETAPTAETEPLIQQILQGKTEIETGAYIYEPAGRRDPFVNPLSGQNTADEKLKRQRPPGFPGMLIGEVQLWGITVYGDEGIGIFRGTDGQGYFVREGDELWDGKVVSIDFDRGEVVFQQKIEDPTSPMRFREVVRRLNP